MKSRILGLLPVGLLAGPMAANAVGVNTAPTADSASYVMLQDTSFNGSLVATDPENDPLSFIVTSPAAHGTLSVFLLTGAFTYTPSFGYLGPDSFVFRASDGSSSSNDATINFRIVEQLPTVPEPGTLALLGLGLAGLGLSRRRKS